MVEAPHVCAYHSPPPARAAVSAAGMTASGDSSLPRLLAVMARLRDPANGCPWDLEQSFETIVPHTIEEAYEVAEAIAEGDRTALRDELGDLLFQVVFYTRIAEEEDSFTFEDVVRHITDKMIRRHPHVFGTADIPDAAARTGAWEAHKAREREEKAAREGRASSALDGVSRALPALTRAQKLQKRAARVGFDWPDMAPVLDKIREELAEVTAELGQPDNRLRVEEEIGDLFFAVINLARHAGVDGETALRRANRKFETRFRSVERALAADGRTPERSTLTEMDRLWSESKKSSGQT